MTSDEYRARILAIENDANEELSQARKRCFFWNPTVRYQSGMADAFIEHAISFTRERIEAEMKAQTEAVEREYYEQGDRCE